MSDFSMSSRALLVEPVSYELSRSTAACVGSAFRRLPSRSLRGA